MNIAKGLPDDEFSGAESSSEAGVFSGNISPPG
jgi:hypothetical protein